MSMDRSALLALAAVLVGACGGGGGGDDGGGGNNPPPPPPVSGAITSDNADEVAGAVVTSTQFVRDFGLPEVAGGFIPSGVSNAQATGSLSRLAHAMGGGIRRGIQSMSEIQAEPIEIDCQLGGQIVITPTVANDETLSVGDIVSVAFNSCTDDTGTTDGTVDLTVTEVTGDLAAPPFSATLDVNMAAVTRVEEASTVSADGLLTALLEIPDETHLSLTLNGTDLATEVEGDSAVLEAFDISEVDDLPSGAFTLEYSGTLNAETLGTFDFETTTPFTGTGGQHPSAGELVIHGDDDTSLSLTPVDAVDVVLSLDTDGDGEEDETINTTWDALNGG